MAEETKETTGQGGSNPPSGIPGGVAKDPEPQILEETIIHKIPPKPSPPAAPAIPVPDPAPLTPETASAYQPNTAPEAPIPQSAPGTTPALSNPPPTTPAASGVPPLAPAAAIIAPAPKSETTAALDTDIAKILGGIKIPERRDVEGGAKASQAKRYDTSLTSTLDKQEAPETPAIVTPSSAKAKSDVVVPVHTLKDDLQGVVRDTKMSVVRAVALESDRRARRANEETPESAPAAQRSKRMIAIVVTSTLFLFLGAAALFAVYFIMTQRTARPAADTSSSLLFSEQSVVLSLDDHSSADIKRTIAAARGGANATLGSITRIVPITSAPLPDGTSMERPATFAEFMKALGVHAPDELIRALGDEFFLGIHTVDKNAPVIIVPVTSYDHAFAGMLAWEPAMNADLAPAFSALPPTARDESGVSIKRSFTDLVMRNYDVRALKDDAGQIQLYYSFPNQHFLVIAESPYSFNEILSRLQAKRQL